MIDELIERVEKGEGADRELDALICVALQWIGPKRPDGLHDGTIQNLRIAEDPSWPDEPWEDLNFEDAQGEAWTETTPAVATSLDAVLALIEEKLPGRGHAYATGWDAKGNCGGFVSPDRRVDLTRAAMGQAASPARALLAAFLRAHKEQHDG